MILYRPLLSSAAGDEITSPRKRPRPVDFESVSSAFVSPSFFLTPIPNPRQSDDEDSDGDSVSHPHPSNVPQAKRDRFTVPTGGNDAEMESSPLGTATLEKEEGPSSRTSNKSSCGIKAEQNFEREYFSESGVKLEVIELPVKYDTKEWLKHVEQCSEGSRTPWRCTWQTMKNGTPMPCDYSSKKHLVKRHIEATHLCIKYVLTKFGWYFVLMR
jgi:hypothetical protein